MAKRRVGTAATRRRRSAAEKLLGLEIKMRPLRSSMGLLHMVLRSERDKLGVGFREMFDNGEVNVSMGAPQTYSLETVLDEKVFAKLPPDYQQRLFKRGVVTKRLIPSKVNNGRIYVEIFKRRKQDDSASQPSDTAKPMGKNEPGRKT